MARFPPGQLQHIIYDMTDMLGVRLDYLCQSLFVICQPVGLGQQLSGVAHCPDRIADFVRDARAQPAQRGKL